MGWLIAVLRDGVWAFTGSTYSTRDMAESIGRTLDGEVRYVRHDPRFGSPSEGTPVEGTGYVLS
jgi:hypothetical protein